MQEQREKISFEVGKQQIVELEFNDGSPVAGRFGDQYQYFLGENKIMWVDPAIREMIVSTGAEAGDKVAIKKTEIRNGNKKRIAWEVARVQRHDEKQRPPVVSQPRAAQLPALPAQLPALPAAPPARDPQAPTQQRIEDLEIQLRETKAAVRRGVDLRIEDAAKARSQANEANPLSAAFITAIEAARAAEAHAGDRLRFTSEDIRALAITVYIELCKRGKGGN